LIINGDSLEVLKTLQANSVDAIVTDPPYGWRFMGKAWDGADIEKTIKNKARKGERYEEDAKRIGSAQSAGLYDNSLTANKSFEKWTTLWAKEIFRVLKPGGHMLVFCGPRTYHRMASGVEDAGFEIRDQLQWIFGSGFPKSHNLKDEWQGWGTALKPANEPICLARKPLEKGLTVAQNVLKWGVGAINVDGSRIDGTPRTTHASGNIRTQDNLNGIMNGGMPLGAYPSADGRWPANVLFDEEAAKVLDLQSGTLKSGARKPTENVDGNGWKNSCKRTLNEFSADSGGASRFFYVAKASKRERNAGLEGMPLKKRSDANKMMGDAGPMKTGSGNDRTTEFLNHHPTVKPVKVMEYLVRLVTPPKGTVLDPFTGSGTTGVAAKNLGFNFIGIEMNEEYVNIARRRIEHVKPKEQIELEGA
jgi:DNA modification methylase